MVKWCELHGEKRKKANAAFVEPQLLGGLLGERLVYPVFDVKRVERVHCVTFVQPPYAWCILRLH